MNSAVLLRRAGAFLNRNSSLLFAGASMIGFAATIFFTAKGTMKADEILAKKKEIEEKKALEAENKEEEKEEPVKVSRFDRIKKVWKCYIPAAICSILTIASIVAGNYISIKKIAALTGTVSFLVAERDNLEKRARLQFGDEAVDKIKKAMALDFVNGKSEIVNPETGEVKEVIKYIPVEVEETGKGNKLYFDRFCGKLFRCSEEAIKKGIENACCYLDTNEIVSVADLHDYWGIKYRSEFADQRGWFHHKDSEDYDYPYGHSSNVTVDGVGRPFIHIGFTTIHNEELGEDMTVIDYVDVPYEGFMEYC